LSPTFDKISVAGNYNTICDSTANDSVTVTGHSNTIYLLNGGSDTLSLSGGIDTHVVGFTPGKGTVVAVSGTVASTGTTILDGMHTAVNGATLSFGTTSAAQAIFVTIGSIGNGTAAEVVSAANKAYQVADLTGNASSGALGEHVVFIGTDSGNSTELWSFKIDSSGSHTANANELTHVATLIGVLPASLTTGDLA
ncbi:hypothetical protein, partial [Telmatospirillum sp.]|uniref:hypothetical protein n=1 Tax=Telmatospirillum sp. TaxID=2079197 RepID=UPI0028404A9D